MKVQLKGIMQRIVPSKDGARVYSDIIGLQGDGNFSVAFNGVTLDELRKTENRVVELTGDLVGRTYKGATNLSFQQGKFSIKVLPDLAL